MGLWLRLVVAVACVGVGIAGSVGKQGVGASSAFEGRERVGPDYADGPWREMIGDHPFENMADRPRLTKALSLLHQVMESVTNLTATAQKSRDDKLDEENSLIADGKNSIEVLKTDIASIKEKAEAFHQIVPTQNQITQIIQNDLSALLKVSSKLYQTDAETRFPFADRLAEYTADLQNVLRVKEETECRLKDFMSVSELKEALKVYSSLASEIQAKIDSEVKAAGEILTPNTKNLEDVKQHIEATETHLKELREQLESVMGDGEGFVPREQNIKEITLHAETALVDAVQRSADAQDQLLDKVKSLEEEQLVLIHHTASLLGGLLTETPDDSQSAFEQPKATQRVKQN